MAPKLMIAYPVPRVFPTERGPGLEWIWWVRGVARRAGGWRLAYGSSDKPTGLVALWMMVRLGLDGTNAAELRAALEAAPGVRVTEFESTEREGGDQ